MQVLQNIEWRIEVVRRGFFLYAVSNSIRKGAGHVMSLGAHHFAIQETAQENLRKREQHPCRAEPIRDMRGNRSRYSGGC